MSLKELLFRLGDNPQKSWANFKVGLGIFVVGSIFILAGSKFSYWLQIPGLVCLLIGGLLAAKGYLGIFANRFSRTLNSLKPPSSEDK